jgi:hypothetical protein
MVLSPAPASTSAETLTKPSVVRAPATTCDTPSAEASAPQPASTPINRDEGAQMKHQI